jgi:hypothetical protein
LHELELGAPDVVQGGDASRTEKQPALCGDQYPRGGNLVSGGKGGP